MKIIFSDLPTASSKACDHAKVPLDPVTELSATSYFSPDYVALSWVNPTPDVIHKFGQDFQINSLKGIRVYRDNALIYEGSDDFYNDIDVESGETYTYKVVAVSTDGVESEPAETTLKFGLRYTIEYRNIDDTLLQSEEVAQGTMPVFRGATPTYTQMPSWTFKGWHKAEHEVTGPETYYATYNMASGWTDNCPYSWKEVFEKCDNGTWGDIVIGQTKIVVYGNYGPARVKYAGKELDAKPNGQKAKMTWNGISVLQDQAEFGIPSSTIRYQTCSIRNYVNSTVFSQMQDSVKRRVVTVTKRTYVGTGPDDTSNENLWLVAAQEIEGSNTLYYPSYQAIYPSASYKIKSDPSGVSREYATRSMGGRSLYQYSTTTYNASGNQSSQLLYNQGTKKNNQFYISPCFCID